MLRVVLLSIVVCLIMLFSATPTLAVDTDVTTEKETSDSAGDEEEDVPMVVTFVNEMPDASIELFWEETGTDYRRNEGVITPRGGYIDVNTFVGHEFSYDLDGQRHYFTPSAPNALGQNFYILAGTSKGFLVRCELSNNDEEEIPTIDILVEPYWGPRGAAHFLELVRDKYYDGVALNRVVPQFLTQFGIAKEYEKRMHWDDIAILDDFRNYADMKFVPGSVSFAGNGPDSRTTEIFIAMPETSQEQLDNFGTNPWETPFGTVIVGDGSKSALAEIYSGYGDMPPWGNGPDSERIYESDGYEYLAKEYPKLDYIQRCYIVDEMYDLDVEEEL